MLSDVVVELDTACRALVVKVCVKVLPLLTVTIAVSNTWILLLTETDVLVITCAELVEVPSVEVIPSVDLEDDFGGVDVVTRPVSEPSEEVAEDEVGCEDATDVDGEDESDDDSSDFTIEDDSEALLENRVGVGVTLEMIEVVIEAVLADNPVPLRGVFCRY